MEAENTLAADLTSAISSSNNAEYNGNLKDLLHKIIVEGKDFKDDIVDNLTLLLETDDEEIQCLVTQTIAEQSICEEKRKKYSQEKIISRLLQFLKSTMEENKLKLIKQTCRALGNICCDNFIGRDLILSLGGTSSIVELLPKSMQSFEDLKSEYTVVRLCVCKLLLNLLLGGTTYIEAALEVNILQQLSNVMTFESKEHNEECLSMSLLVVSVILDNKPTIILERDFNLLVVEILKETENIEISEMCLEHLHAQAEHDEVKNVLAKAEVPQLLWRLLQEHSSLAVNEEKRAVMKLACDLIVLALTGDDSMHLLYGNGSGEVYLAMVEWLEAADADLVTTAVLALGNFARTDTHCLHMMDSGVFAKLLNILISHKSSEDDIRLQHAVLSTLRNLVVPQQNKPLAIERGILPVLTEMLPTVTQYHVVFKLLASLRMLVDKQESVAMELVSCGMLEQVTQWAARWEHPGVTGEAQRLLAWTIRQLHSTQALAQVLQVEGCVSCLVNMLVGSHVIMQNEAIISLTILCLAFLDPLTEINDNNQISETESYQDTNGVSSSAVKLTEDLIKAEVGKQLKTMIETNLNVLQLEILENICKFITILIKSRELCSHLHQQEVNLALGRCITEREDIKENIKKSIESVMNDIESATE